MDYINGYGWERVGDFIQPMLSDSSSDEEDKDTLDDDIVTDTLNEHKKKWINNAIYFSRFKCLVSCADDRRVRLYNMAEKRNVLEYKFRSSILYLLKWNDETFLTGSRNGDIVKYSLLKPNEKEVIFSHPRNHGAHRLMKISEEFLLCLFLSSIYGERKEFYCKFVIFNYHEKRKSKRLKCMEKGSSTCFIMNSKENFNSFYYGCKGRVYLIDHEVDHILCKFKAPNDDGSINVFSIYTDHLDREILVGGGRNSSGKGKSIYFFYREQPNPPHCIRKIDLQRLKGPGYFDTLYSCLIVRNNYLFFGGYCGSLFYLDISQPHNQHNSKILKRRIQKESTMTNICFMGLEKDEEEEEKRKERKDDDDEEDEIISLCLCYDNGIMKIVRLRKDEFLDKTNEDFKDRVSLLREMLWGDRCDEFSSNVISCCSILIFKSFFVL